MVQITIDEELQRRLLFSEEIVELYDETGNRLGYLLQPTHERDIWKALCPKLTEQEIESKVG